MPRRLLAAAACAAALLIIPSAASGQGFSEPFAVSPAGHSDYVYVGDYGGYPRYIWLFGLAGPDVAVNASGAAVASWIRRDEDGPTMVEASYRPPGGTFGPPQRLATVRNHDNAGVTVAGIDSRGRAMVLWQGLDSSYRRIVRYATARPGGPFGASIVIPGSSGAEYPVAVLTPSGDAVAAWRNGDRAVRAAVRAPGRLFGTAQVLIGGPAGSAPQVDAIAGGRAAISWNRSTGQGATVVTALRPAGGPFGAPVDVSLPRRSVEWLHQAMATDGRVAVTWNGRDPADGMSSLQVRLLTPEGLPAGAPETLPVTGTGHGPHVAFDGAGTAVAAWGQCRKVNLATICSTAVAERQRDGAFGPAATIAGYTGTNGILELWSGPGGHIVGSAYGSNGRTIKYTRRISGTTFTRFADIVTGTAASAPSLGIDASGRTTAVWPRSDDPDMVMGATSAAP